MPCELLTRLCATEAPVMLEGVTDINMLRVLRARKLVDAEIPPVIDDGEGALKYAGPAMVFEVTPQGIQAAKNGPAIPGLTEEFQESSEDP